RHDRLFPVRLPAVVGAAFALLFAGIIAGVHADDRLIEQLLDRLLDLNLVRARRNPKHVLVMLLAEQRQLFGQGRRLDDIEMLVHFPASSADSVSVLRRRVGFPSAGVDVFPSCSGVPSSRPAVRSASLASAPEVTTILSNA